MNQFLLLTFTLPYIVLINATYITILSPKGREIPNEIITFTDKGSTSIINEKKNKEMNEKSKKTILSFQSSDVHPVFKQIKLVPYDADINGYSPDQREKIFKNSVSFLPIFSSNELMEPEFSSETSDIDQSKFNSSEVFETLMISKNESHEKNKSTIDSEENKSYLKTYNIQNSTFQTISK